MLRYDNVARFTEGLLISTVEVGGLNNDDEKLTSDIASLAEYEGATKFIKGHNGNKRSLLTSFKSLRISEYNMYVLS